MDANDKSGKEYTAIDIVDGSKKSKKCIFRVPNVLRRQKPEAYTPDVVSIGPFHDREQKNKEEAKAIKAGKKAGKKGGISEKDYQFMERVKQSYLDEILTGMEIKTLEDLIPKVTEHSCQAYRQKKKQDEGEDDKNFRSYCNSCSFDERARSFYAEPLDDIAQEDFIKMMVVDGCFLVQLFRKCHNFKLRDFDDLVFNMDCMFHFLCHDILLLENQLPWFVLHSLYNLTHHLYHDEPRFLSVLILNALRIVPSLEQSCNSYRCPCDAGFLHILDLVRTSIVPPKTPEPRAAERAGRVEAKTDSTKEQQVNSGSKRWRGESGDNESVRDDLLGPDEHQIRTATALSKADIKFKGVKNRKSIMDIEFEDVRCYRNGTLIIPQLNVGMSSETLFRNLIAAEQCYHGYSNAITSYAIFMDNLISSKEDMELLSKKNVIGNLMSDEDGCEFFSNLYKDIPHNKKFYYKELCKKVNDRYKLRRYTWLAILKSEKFSNPWRILAFGLGFILLFLTAWSSANNIRIHWKK